MKERVRFMTRELYYIYMKNRVNRYAAALSHYMVFSIFPTLICLYALLARNLPDPTIVVRGLENIFPQSTAEALAQFLQYVGTNANSTMIAVAVFTMLWCGSGVFRCIHTIMSDIQGGARFRGAVYILVSFLFGTVFLFVIYFSVVVLLTGNWFLQLVDRYQGVVHATSAWSWLRFVLLYGLVLMIVFSHYRVLTPKGFDGNVFSGAVIATTVIVIVCVAMSGFIGFFSRYPLIYGSLASIVMLMLWLYVCGTVVIMGNAWNVALRRWRKRRSHFPVEERPGKKKKRG